MAVAASRSASSKLISVNSNEGLIPSNEKRQHKETGKSSIDGISMISTDNHGASCLSSSGAESKIAGVEKPRPCSGCSILKRSSRPSSGHSVKFVESEDIIPSPNTTISSPSPKNLLIQEFKKTTLETINQQEPLRLINKSTEEMPLQNNSLPLSKLSSHMFSITNTTENDENRQIWKENTNVEDDDFYKSLPQTESAVTNQPARQKSKDITTEVVIANQHVKKQRDSSPEITTKTPTFEEGMEERNKEANCNEDRDEIASSSYQPQQFSSRCIKGDTFRRKKAIYNAENCPSDGDMSREGFFSSNRNEVEKRHIRHKTLKLKFSEENVLERKELVVMETNRNNSTENDLPQIGIDSEQIPTHKKKRLYELFKELKRVRDAIAQMYSLEATEKEKLVTDATSMEENHLTSEDKGERVNDLVDDTKNDEEENKSHVQMTAENIMGSKETDDDEVDIPKSSSESDNVIDLIESFETLTHSQRVNPSMPKDLVTKYEKYDINSSNFVCTTNQKNENDEHQAEKCIEQKTTVSFQEAQQFEISEQIANADSVIPSTALCQNYHDSSETMQMKTKSIDSVENNICLKTIEMETVTFNQDINKSQLELRKGNTEAVLISQIQSLPTTELEESVLKEPEQNEETKPHHEDVREKYNKQLTKKSNVKTATAEETDDDDKVLMKTKDTVTCSNIIYAEENKNENKVCDERTLTKTDTDATIEGKTESASAVLSDNRNATSVKNLNFLNEKSTTTLSANGQIGERKYEIIKTDRNENREIENIVSDVTHQDFSMDDDSDPATEVNLEFVIRENTKEIGLKEDEALRESFTDSALMMSPPKGREDDYFDCEDDLSDNDETLEGTVWNLEERP